jgi:hypothetical protein
MSYIIPTSPTAIMVPIQIGSQLGRLKPEDPAAFEPAVLLAAELPEPVTVTVGSTEDTVLVAEATARKSGSSQSPVKELMFMAAVISTSFVLQLTYCARWTALPV